jgi:hypothetical protein
MLHKYFIFVKKCCLQKIRKRTLTKKANANIDTKKETFLLTYIGG